MHNQKKKAKDISKLIEHTDTTDRLISRFGEDKNYIKMCRCRWDNRWENELNDKVAVGLKFKSKEQQNNKMDWWRTDLGWWGIPSLGTSHVDSVHRPPLPGLAGAAGVSSGLRSAGGEQNGRAAPGWGGPWWCSHTERRGRRTTLDCKRCPASASAAGIEKEMYQQLYKVSSPA